MNQAKKLKAYQKLIRAKVSIRTGMSVEELRQLQFNQAYKYLEEVLQVSAYGLEHLPKTPQFWAWWETEWNRIDRIYLENLPGLSTCEYARERYIKVHDSVMSNTYINSAVMSASRSQMMSRAMRNWEQFCKNLSAGN